MARVRTSEQRGFVSKRKEEPWIDWLRECADDPKSPTGLKRDLLGMITGQDYKALGAIDACWRLWANCDDDGEAAARAAVVALLQGMQPKCWLFARELIAHRMDWSDRERIWPAVRAEAVLALESKRLHATDHLQGFGTALDKHIGEINAVHAAKAAEVARAVRREKVGECGECGAEAVIACWECERCSMCPCPEGCPGDGEHE